MRFEVTNIVTDSYDNCRSECRLSMIRGDQRDLTRYVLRWIRRGFSEVIVVTTSSRKHLPHGIVSGKMAYGPLTERGLGKYNMGCAELENALLERDSSVRKMVTWTLGDESDHYIFITGVLDTHRYAGTDDLVFVIQSCHLGGSRWSASDSSFVGVINRVKTKPLNS